MSNKGGLERCMECEDGTAVVHDPRDPPISTDICLCVECGEGALEETLEEARERLDDLKEQLRKLNPDSAYLNMSRRRKPKRRDDVRLLKPGEMLDNIPLVECPACGKTAFSLGHEFRGTDWNHGMESFCHVVENLTATSGDVIEFCDYEKEAIE